jgi:dTDP-4-dehydrorhamnose reductase
MGEPVTLRVLVTGASGRLGGRLASLLGDSFEVIGTQHRNPAPETIPSLGTDLTQEGAIARLLDRVRPDAVVHAAAMAEVEPCEKAAQEAHAINAGTWQELGYETRRRQIRVIALSTDLVFDGGEPNRRPEDPARPLMRYGISKFAGEQALLSEAPDATVARIALVIGCGHHQPTASESVLFALQAGKPLRLYTDQFRSPVDPESVADAICRMLVGSSAGLYHIGGPERVSRHQLGLRVAAQFGLAVDGITAVRQADNPPLVPRPADVSLDSSRTEAELGWKARPLDVGISESRLRAPSPARRPGPRP